MPMTEALLHEFASTFAQLGAIRLVVTRRKEEFDRAIAAADEVIQKLEGLAQEAMKP